MSSHVDTTCTVVEKLEKNVVQGNDVILLDKHREVPVPDATMRVWGDDGSFSPDIQDCGLVVFEHWPHRITVVADGYASVELVDEVPETVYLYREPTSSAERAARD